MATELRIDRTRMEGIGEQPLMSGAPMKLQSKEGVGGLRLTVGDPRIVGALVEIDVLEIDPTHPMCTGADANHAGIRRPTEQRQSGDRQQEMAEMIGRQLKLMSVDAARQRSVPSDFA